MFANSFTTNNDKTLWQKDYPTDYLKSYYNLLNWKNTVISGSYALKLYTGASWDANDIDIVIAGGTFEEFMDEVKKFVYATESTITKTNNFMDGPKPGENLVGLDKRDEKFHEVIKATVTIEVPDIPIPVQFIYLCDGNFRDSTPELILAEIQDVPACVTYKADKGVQLFTIPAKGREALTTGHVCAKDICPSRKEKYEKRGYHFY